MSLSTVWCYECGSRTNHHCAVCRAEGVPGCPGTCNGHAPDPDFVAGTLAWCNEIRAEQGKEPLDRLPRGHVSDPASCPCGLATGMYVDADSYIPKDQFPAGSQWDENAPRLPTDVMLFVEAFDEIQLPQYIASRKDRYV